MVKLAGPIAKMKTALLENEPVRYELPVGDERLPLNDLLGRGVRLSWSGVVRCLHCGRESKKSFGQGYCYPCFRSLASCDQCIIKPELCHYHLGTCREPAWGESHCLIPHTVYLANSSAIKVGITRGESAVARWIDQGASQGLAIRRVGSRLESGMVEIALKRFVADKTNWRKMLKSQPEPLDLISERDALLARQRELEPEIELPGSPLEDDRPLDIRYPVLEFPEKVVSHNLDKSPRLEGTLVGLKGQYWILDTAVINIRKYGGYVLEVEAS